MRALLRAADYPFFDNGGRPLAFAHRGGALTGENVGIENTMAAVEAAVALGYRYLETDVHATRDGEVVAFHDATLARVTGLPGTVAAVDSADLRGARLAGREPVALLRDILSAWPELRVNVDCKADTAVEPLARVIREQRAADRVCVASFSARRLHALRARLGPRVATSYTALGVTALRLGPSRRLRRLVVGSRGQAAQVPVRAGRLEVVTAGFVQRAHDLGKHVHVWTVDDSAEMHRLLDLGVDGLMTDRADLLRGVLRERGHW